MEELTLLQNAVLRTPNVVSARIKGTKHGCAALKKLLTNHLLQVGATSNTNKSTSQATHWVEAADTTGNELVVSAYTYIV